MGNRSREEGEGDLFFLLRPGTDNDVEAVKWRQKNRQVYNNKMI